VSTGLLAYWWTFDILSKPYLFTSSKINQSYTVILFTVQEYIFKLDVAVAYLLLMQVGKSLQKLSHYLYSFGLPQFIPPHHLIVKWTTCAQFLNNHQFLGLDLFERVLITKNIIDLKNVGMIELLYDVEAPSHSHVVQPFHLWIIIYFNRSFVFSYFMYAFVYFTFLIW